MFDFNKPNIEITEISDDKRYGRFVVEPLERGYGTTLAQAVKLNANPPKRHLLIGHQNMPLQMLGFDLFAATGELSNRFSQIGRASCRERV